MKRFLFSLLVLGVCWSSVSADEKVFVKGKEIKMVIKKESGTGVSGPGKDIPAEEILDIEYEINPIGLRFNYRKARDFEKDSLEKESGRKLNLAEAIKTYEDTLAKIMGQPDARRNIEFRIAVLRYRQATEFGQFVEFANQKLEEYKTKHPDSWQITQALRLLANLQLSQKKYAQAEKTYLELSKAPVAEDTRQEAEFQAAQVSVQAGNYDQALKSLRALATKLPKDNRFGMRARVGEAECLAVANKTEEANKLLRGILKDSSDKTLKAMAYNTLGKNLFKAGQFKEARWEFLWVDVVYNQDKTEHAKALYYLSQVFEKLGEADRSQECRELLLSDRSFAGTEFQRLAQADAK